MVDKLPNRPRRINKQKIDYSGNTAEVISDQARSQGGATEHLHPQSRKNTTIAPPKKFQGATRNKVIM